jgi:predicted porin
MELGLTYAMGSDSVVFYYGTVDDKFSEADEAKKTTGLELGYNTTVGPVALGVGYGSKSKSDADDTAGTVNDGYSYTDIEVKMSMSF